MSLQDATNNGLSALNWTDIRLRKLVVDDHQSGSSCKQSKCGSSCKLVDIETCKNLIVKENIIINGQDLKLYIEELYGQITDLKLYIKKKKKLKVLKLKLKDSFEDKNKKYIKNILENYNDDINFYNRSYISSFIYRFIFGRNINNAISMRNHFQKELDEIEDYENKLKQEINEIEDYLDNLL